MRRGEVWWALIDERRPVVILSGEESSEYRAIQVVEPATADEKRGYALLSGEEASDPRAVQIAVSAGTGIRAVGVEVAVGVLEGFPLGGVVRLALPRLGETNIPCTWLVTMTPGHLIERVGSLSPAQLDQLDNALGLAGIE
jgi:mRNA interferase MazF